MSFGNNDILAAPAHAKILLVNRNVKLPIFLLQIGDAPQRKCSLFEVFL